MPQRYCFAQILDAFRTARAIAEKGVERGVTAEQMADVLQVNVKVARVFMTAQPPGAD